MKFNWIKVWFMALFRPSISYYEELSNNPQAVTKIGYIWVIITGIIGAVISALAPGFSKTIVISLLCGIPFLAIGSLLMLIVIAGSAHLIASRLGGVGSYSRMVYVIAAFSAPITILSALVFLVPFWKLLLAILTIYWVILTIMAVKAVYKISWAKSTLSSVAIIVLSLMAIIVLPLIPLPS